MARCDPPPRSPLARAALALALAASCLLAGAAHAGAWVPEPGAGYAKLGLRWLPGFGYFPGPGHAAAEGWSGPQPYGGYHELFVETYAELGVAPGVALTFGDPLLRTFLLADPRDGEVGAHVSTGEPGLGAVVALIRERRFSSSVQVAVRAPLAPGDPVQPVIGTADGHPEIGALTIGTGVWEVEGTLAGGVGWDRGYVAATVGVAARGGGFDALLRWSLEGGRPLGPRGHAQGRLRLTGQHPLGNGAAPYHRSPSGLGNGTRFLAFTVEIERRVAPGVWLGASVAGGMGAVARQTGGPVIGLYAAFAGGGDG